MKIEQYLQRAGKSITSERVLLAKWMKSQHLFTANDIQKNFSTVSRASVFRTLKLFVEI